jgi:hypothetical protein
MGKSSISMAIFNSYVTNYQRVIKLDKKESLTDKKTSADDFPILLPNKKMQANIGFVCPHIFQYSFPYMFPYLPLIDDLAP